MGYRYKRPYKKDGPEKIDANTLIERMRKVRALNCKPSDVGMDNYVMKFLSIDRSNGIVKII